MTCLGTFEFVSLRLVVPMNSPEFRCSLLSPRNGAWVSLIVIGLLAFWPTMWFDFVNWDDPAYVWDNDLIKSWSPSTLYGVATETVTRNYAPATIGTLLIDHTLWGMQPGGYHATNVLLHLINGLLVFVLTRKFTCNPFVSWLTAALFLVHPVQIETVAWISSRKGLLSATFMLAALIVRLKPCGATATTETDAKQDLWYVLWLGGALMSKALAVVVPPIVLLYDVVVLRRRFGESLVRQVIPGLMSLLLLLKTMAAQHTVLGGLRGHLEMNLLQILAVDVTILWQYIGMLVWPSDLCVLYDPPTSNIAGSVVLAAAGGAVISVSVWRARHRSPALLWSAVSFLLLLLPVLNFFRITTLMNDRYLYLPCILFFGTAATGLDWMLSGVFSHADRLIRLIAGVTRWSLCLTVVAAALSVTVQHLPVWKNSFTLWNHAMTKVPRLPVVRMQLALTHYDCGRKREAVRILQQGLLECQPDKRDRKRMNDATEQWLHELGQQTAAMSSAHR
jgi:hypothetical protein